ncbi:beta-1,4-glucuronyltransferase 1-like [Leptopilina boulardi]|uniref:beta-1,4-glucuronyltransferase 1-like n=1 Tax=Leptopilina boulardi TaxID=63433 RepID=UPI0021F5ED8B|nr:beta-1,4-glucuronyltransferase 1-like [Leptopilina boulardi]
MRKRWYRLFIWFVFIFSIFLSTRLLLGKGLSRSIPIFFDGEHLERSENAHLQQELPTGKTRRTRVKLSTKILGVKLLVRWVRPTRTPCSTRVTVLAESAAYIAAGWAERTRVSFGDAARAAKSGAPLYAAGSYMAGKQMKNLSFCNWHYSLPHEFFYSSSEIIFSPEAGDKGPYRILPLIIAYKSKIIEQLPQITLCTHSTADQVYSIVELARRWEGPLSFSIFAPGLDAGLAVALLDRACHCEPTMFKVSVHLIFPTGRPPALGDFSQYNKDDCAASDLQWREADTERKQRKMTYPINVARNIARLKSKTERVLVSDIELLPSLNLASGFEEMLKERITKINVVFVLPVFEIEANQMPPVNKNQLLDAIKDGSAVYFHRYVCPHCQRFPGLTRKWLLRPNSGKVKPLIVTREFPNHRWEPVFIGTKNDPLYTEDMTWEGRQDKMAQIFEMCLMNYRLIILDGAFLVHTPGIKRKIISNNNKTPLIRAQERRNGRIYQNVIKRLLKQFHSNRKCKQ